MHFKCDAIIKQTKYGEGERCKLQLVLVSWLEYGESLSPLGLFRW